MLGTGIIDLAVFYFLLSQCLLVCDLANFEKSQQPITVGVRLPQNK